MKLQIITLNELKGGRLTLSRGYFNYVGLCIVHPKAAKFIRCAILIHIPLYTSLNRSSDCLRPKTYFVTFKKEGSYETSRDFGYMCGRDPLDR